MRVGVRSDKGLKTGDESCFFCGGGFKSCLREMLCVLKDFRFSAVALFWFCW